MLHTIHPTDKTVEFDIGTGSDDPTSVQLWKTINSWGVGAIIGALSRAFPPVGEVTLGGGMSPQQQLMQSQMQGNLAITNVRLSHHHKTSPDNR